MTLDKEDERNRIGALEFLSRLHPGHETTIAEFIQDGKTSGPDAVEKLQSAAKANGAAGVVKLRRRGARA